jgi:hypothetical protein
MCSCSDEHAAGPVAVGDVEAGEDDDRLGLGLGLGEDEVDVGAGVLLVLDAVVLDGEMTGLSPVVPCPELDELQAAVSVAVARMAAVAIPRLTGRSAGRWSTAGW